MKTICFSIISHGHGPMLHRLLTQLNAQHTLAGARVVVTLNLADEIFSTELYPSLDLIVISNPSPKGFSANHNNAFKHCESQWFGVLNPDIMIVGGEPFTDMLNRLQMQSEAEAASTALVAPRVVGPDLMPEDSIRSNLTPWSLVKRALGDRQPLTVQSDARKGGPFYWMAGMCMLVRASTYRAVGGFDERFFLYCEDYDLCARLYMTGYAIRLDEQAYIIHEAQRNSHRAWRHLRWHLCSVFKVWSSAIFWRITFLVSFHRLFPNLRSMMSSR